MLRALHVIAKDPQIRKWLEDNDPQALKQVEDAIAHCPVRLQESVDRLVQAAAETTEVQSSMKHYQECDKCARVHDLRLVCPPVRVCMCGGTSFEELGDTRYLECLTCHKVVEK
jgi:hypothetical protein